MTTMNELTSFLENTFIKYLNKVSLEKFSSVFILPVSMIGLANRLRTIASYYSIITKLNGTMIVPWLPDSSCGAGFHDLFSFYNDLPVLVLDVPLTALLDQEEGKLDGIINTFTISFLRKYVEETNQIWKVMTSPDSFFLNETDFDPALLSIHGYYIRTRGSHTLSIIPCEEYLDYKYAFYHAIEPSVSIRHLYQQILQQYFHHYHHQTDATNDYATIDIDISSNGRNEPVQQHQQPPKANNNIYGLHIRTHDVRHDWAMVSPLQSHQQGSSEESNDSNSSNSAMDFTTAVPFAAYLQLIDDILLRDNTATFFLAANDITIKQRLLAIYGEEHILTILSSDKDEGQEQKQRESKEGMLLAALEWLLLSHCDLILHTHASSYARAAGFCGKIPVLDIRQQPQQQMHQRPEDRAVLFYSLYPPLPPPSLMTLPECALPEYIRVKLDSQIGDNQSRYKSSKRVCYWEDGGREMCTMTYLICPCCHLVAKKQDMSSAHALQAIDVINQLAYCPQLYSDESKGASSVADEEENLSGCYEIMAESNGYTI